MPNLGYEVAGASLRVLNGAVRGMKVTMPEAGAPGVTVTAFISDSAPGDGFRAALISNADNTTVLASSTVRTDISTAGWYTFSGGSFASFAPTNGQIFTVAVASNSAANANMNHDANTVTPLDGWVGSILTLEPLALNGPLGIDASRDYSIFLTYTAAGASGDATGTASGAATVAGIGASVAAATGTATGVASSAGVTASLAAATGTVTGHATVVGVTEGGGGGGGGGSTMLALDFLINFAIGLLRGANPTWTAGYAKVQLIAQARASFPGVPVNEALRRHCFAIWEASQGSTYEGVIQLDSPLAYFRLDEPAGTVAEDIGAAATNFVYSSDVAGWIPRTPGAVTDNAAVTFDGVTRRILGEVGVPWLPLSSDNFSVEWWIKAAAATPARIFDIRAGAFAWLAMTFITAGVLRVQRRDADGTSEGILDFPASLFDGAWHHCVYVNDGATMRIYLDAVAVGTTPSPVGAFPPPNIIGIGANAFAEVDFFTGMLDEVAMYPAPLTPARITAHFDARTLPSP